MANTYSYKGYCETTDKESNMISDIVIIGGYILSMIAFTVIVWYGVSIGIYVDPTSIS